VCIPLSRHVVVKVDAKVENIKRQRIWSNVKRALLAGYWLLQEQHKFYAVYTCMQCASFTCYNCAKLSGGGIGQPNE
jgi:hypothetical protein